MTAVYVVSTRRGRPRHTVRLARRTSSSSVDQVEATRCTELTGAGALKESAKASTIE